MGYPKIWVATPRWRNVSCCFPSVCTAPENLDAVVHVPSRQEGCVDGLAQTFLIEPAPHLKNARARQQRVLMNHNFEALQITTCGNVVRGTVTGVIEFVFVFISQLLLYFFKHRPPP
jgi:hypothetical protein